MAGSALVGSHIAGKKLLRNMVMVDLHCSKDNFITLILKIIFRNTSYPYSLHNKKKTSPLCYMHTLKI
jgi:hypothetical protein